MAFIQCSLGERAQLNATHNLGAFIQHVAALPASAVSLVAPKNEHGDAARGLDPVLAGIRAVLGADSSAPRSEVTRMPVAAELGNHRWADLLSPSRSLLSVWDSTAAQALEGALGVAPGPVH